MKSKPLTVFWGNARVSHEAILKKVSAETRARLAGEKRVLLVQDTTSFNFSHHPATEGVGPLENAHAVGFLAHSTLAVSEVGVPLGVLKQDVWMHNPTETGKRAQRHERAFTEKESYKWVKGLPFAVELGAPGITVSPGLAHPADDTAAYDRAVDALRGMVTTSKSLGLRVSIEPHLDSMASTPEMALKFLNDVPDLSLTLDWAHFACQGIPHEQIAALLPKARHLHLRQAAPDKLQTPFEMGTIDFKRVLADAVAAGYDGRLCIEYMNTPGWHGMMAVNAARESARLRDTLRDLRNGLQAKA